MDLLINNYQVTPEERAAVKKMIQDDWDPNQHIIKLFSNLKEHLTTLGEMKNAITYPDEDFTKAVYMAVKKMKQFTKTCEKWKQKPFAKRSTAAQARAYFKGAYEIFDALVTTGARSRATGYTYLGNDKNNKQILNGPISIITKIIKGKIIKEVMSSAAEAEIGALYMNARQLLPLQVTCKELGHPQPVTPMQTDNNTASGIINGTINQARSKATKPGGSTRVVVGALVILQIDSKIIKLNICASFCLVTST